MILKLTDNASAADAQKISGILKAMEVNFLQKSLYGNQLFLLFSNINSNQKEELSSLSIVDLLVDTGKDYKLASSLWKPERTIIDVRGSQIGGDEAVIIAGPCSVESEEQIFQVAEYLHSLGAKYIRGGAYKPRTSPYSFQGLGKEGLRLIRAAADKYDLRVVTEVIDTSLIDEIAPYADILQVGSRNMQNFYFLKELGKIDKPILLKRGMYARINEWLMAAEYILSSGNEKVILCERGIRTFDTTVRNTMDIGAIPLLKTLSHLPVLADPSHGTGQRNLVEPLALASLAAGADGLMVEIHPEPEKALSDGMQSLYLEQFTCLLARAAVLGKAIGRDIDTGKSLESNHKLKDVCVE